MTQKHWIAFWTAAATFVCHSAIRSYASKTHLLLFSCSAMSNSVRPHGLQHTRFSHPSPSPSLLRLMSIELVIPSNHLIICRPFSCPQSFPSSGSFPMSWLFSSSALSNTEIPWLFPVFWISPVLHLHLFPLASLISFAGPPIPSFHLAPLSQLFLFPSLLLGAF